MSPAEPLAADRAFVDINTVFGPEHGLGRAADAPLSLLVEERVRHGVRLALASSLVAAAADPWRGNRLAVEAASDAANGLRAIAVVAARETDSSRRVAEAERHGVVGYRIDGWTTPATPSTAMLDLLRAIAATGRPLLVPLSGVAQPHDGAASAIGAATAGLGIPVILLGAHYTHIVDDLAAARRYEHLYLETSSLAHFRAVATAVSTIGAERVLLGTGSPERAAAAAIDAVLLAAIPDDAKRAILAGNACRLFGLDAVPVDLTPPELPARAWDAHTHYGPFDQDVPQVADADLVATLLAGPDDVAVASSAAAIYADPVFGNAQAAAASRAGGRQLSYVVADPYDLAFTDAQLRQHLGKPGVVGVKVHGNVLGVPTSSRTMSELFDLLARFGRPVKIHNEGADWAAALGEIARAHAQLPIVIAHAGLGTPSIDAGRLSAANDHVYIEFSSSFARLEQVRGAVAAAPVERILWGSDVPLLDPTYVYGTYQDAGIARADWERVFWTNSAELYRRG